MKHGDDESTKKHAPRCLQDEGRTVQEDLPFRVLLIGQVHRTNQPPKMNMIDLIDLTDMIDQIHLIDLAMPMFLADYQRRGGAISQLQFAPLHARSRPEQLDLEKQ